MAKLVKHDGKFPCAYCGNTGKDIGTGNGIILVRDNKVPVKYRYHYSCNLCGASGPTAEEAHIALALWNQRPNIVSAETDS